MEISNDPMFIVLNELDDEDLVNYCQVNKKTSKICNNQIFWYNRIRKKFPYIPLEVLNKYKKQLNYENWSDYYIKGLRKPSLNNDIRKNFRYIPLDVLIISKEQLDELLLKSSKNGRLDLVMMALNKGADVRAQSNQALFNATINGHLNIVEYLIEEGADVRARDDFVLVLAAEYGHLEILKYLIEKGANIHGLALVFAAKYGHLEILKYLIEKGANIPNKDMIYELALGWAENNEDLAMIKYLESLL